MSAIAAVELPGWTVAVPLFLGLITLWVNGDRAERTRKLALYSRALDAVLAYREMPFMIRRRRHEVEERSAERVRLSSAFSEIQSELAACQHLMAADAPEWLADAYGELIKVARKIAGGEAHDAWCEEPIASDAETNMPELFARMGPVNTALDRFEVQLEWAGRTRHRRWLRKRPPSDSDG